MKTISSSDFLKKFKAGDTVVLDVRSPDEYSYKHIPSSRNIPAEQLSARLGEIPTNSDIYLICQSGVRSSAACQKLESLGLSQATSIEGGLNAYEKSGGAIAQDRQTLPIMRQVQIVAGTLVVLGIVLSQFLHPAFIYLALFVGCGLVFAGISGFCGMALLLNKMPWNKIQNKGSDTKCCNPKKSS